MGGADGRTLACGSYCTEIFRFCAISITVFGNYQFTYSGFANDFSQIQYLSEHEVAPVNLLEIVHRKLQTKKVSLTSISIPIIGVSDNFKEDRSFSVVFIHFMLGDYLHIVSDGTHIPLPSIQSKGFHGENSDPSILISERIIMIDDTLWKRVTRITTLIP